MPASSECSSSRPFSVAAPVVAPLHELQPAAIADSRAVTEINLALIWRELVLGLTRVVDEFYTDERCGLVLGVPQSTPAVPMPARRLSIVEAMLSGVCQKHIAIDLDLAPSTVAFNARLGLEHIGVGCRPSRVHPLLMLTATAGLHDDSSIVARVAPFGQDSDPLRVIGIRRPDAQLAGLLPEAELEVVKRLVEGQPYAAIARQRGTSQRTIANQLAGAFRKLQVSGRSELLHRLFVLDGAVKPLKARPLLPSSVCSEPPAPISSARASHASRDSRISGVRPLSSLPALAALRGA